MITMSNKKRFSVGLTLDEMYAIRNALQGKGEDALLERITKNIKTLHDYFDGRLHVSRGCVPCFYDKKGNDY